MVQQTKETPGVSVSESWSNIAKHLQKPQIWYNRLKKHQVSVSASLDLGFARWHMQTMQTSEFLPLLDHSSGSAVSWDVFRGGWHCTAISGILLWRVILSRAGGGLSFLSSCLLSSFCQISPLDLFYLLSHIFKLL